MKTWNLSVATVVLGALAVSYSACSAQGIDNVVPGGTSAPPGGQGSNATAGTSNGSGGSAPITGSGGSVTFPGAGGSAPAAGGSKFNTGVSGATSGGGRGPVGTAGSSTGSGGSSTVGGCKAAAGTVTEVAIDDLEDGDNVITTAGSRIGYWYTFNDGTAVQDPDPKVLFKPKAGGSTASPKFAATTSGPIFTKYGAGMGFDFNNTSSKSCPYDASAYSGITFWAKGNTGNMAGMMLKAMIKIPATTPVSADSGACPSTSMCEDHFNIKAALTTTWTKFSMPFATIKQDNFGAPATFDKAHILAVQFQVPQNVKFDFSVDDIAFTP